MKQAEEGLRKLRLEYLKSPDRKVVPVQVRPRAPIFRIILNKFNDLNVDARFQSPCQSPFRRSVGRFYQLQNRNRTRRFHTLRPRAAWGTPTPVSALLSVRTNLPSRSLCATWPENGPPPDRYVGANWPGSAPILTVLVFRPCHWAFLALQKK